MRALKTGPDYIITVRAFLSCGSRVDQPWLTVPIDKRATLVLPSEDHSECECETKLAVKLSDRVESGDLVYVLANREVVGHAVVP